METRHLEEGLFGSAFSSTCNHCVVMTTWSRKTFKCCEEFLRFLNNDPLRCAEILKFLFRKLLPPHRSTTFKCRKNLSDGKSMKSCVIYLTKNRPPLNMSLMRGQRPKSARTSPNYVLRVLQISSKSVHLRRSYSHCQTFPSGMCWIFVYTKKLLYSYIYEGSVW